MLYRRLFHFPARRVGFGSAKREVHEHSQGTHHNYKFLHHSSLVEFLLVATTTTDHRLSSTTQQGRSADVPGAGAAVEKPLSVVAFEAAPASCLRQNKRLNLGFRTREVPDRCSEEGQLFIDSRLTSLFVTSRSSLKPIDIFTNRASPRSPGPARVEASLSCRLNR